MEHAAGLGGMPQAQGIAGRLEAWLAKHADMPGASFLAEMVPFAVKTFGFEPDAFVHELVDSIIGDNYPVPDRMLVHNERITHEYLMWAMCGNPRPAGKFDLYAVEGGTAAMCYIFKSLKANRLLHPGDTIALGTPIFTPYIEMTHLEDYALKVVNIEAPQENRLPVHRRGAQEAGGPEDQGVLRRQSRQSDGRRAQQGDDRQDRQAGEDEASRPDAPDRRRVRNVRPGLPLAARRAAAQHDRRVLLLEVLRLHGLAARRHRRPRRQHLRQDDREASGHAICKALDKRYGALTLEPRKVKFIDRIVADSRDVALNHTAGLSLPQQVMMSLFSLAELMDGEKRYQNACTRDRAPARPGHDRGPGPRAQRRTRSTTPTTA